VHIQHGQFDELVVSINGLEQRYYVAKSANTENFTDEDFYHFPLDLFIHHTECGSVLLTKIPRFRVHEASYEGGATSSHKTLVEDNKEGVSVYRASMPGKVVKVLVKAGDEVKQGDTLIVLEAMKMETNLNATHKGVVEKVGVKVGDVVNVKARLVEVAKK